MKYWNWLVVNYLTLYIVNSDTVTVIFIGEMKLLFNFLNISPTFTWHVFLACKTSAHVS